MGIEEEGVPDYWWAGIRAVESEAKVDMKGYATIEDLGDIDTALLEIIELQEELLIPDASEVAY
jgi:hypothetical protein